MPGVPADPQGQSFGPLTGRWPRRPLTVFILAQGVLGPSEADARDIVKAAFKTWQDAASIVADNSLSFVFLDKALPVSDINVVFLPESLVPEFTPPTPLLGIGFPPGSDRAGQLFLNVRHFWTKVELQWVALHEIGHTLGFPDSHTNMSYVNPTSSSDLPVATMHPTSQNLALDAEALSALRAAYGWTVQQQLKDRSTEHRPSLGVVARPGQPEVPKMVWKGNGETKIWESDWQPDLTGWGQQQPLPQLGGTSHRPVLAPLSVPAGAVLMMAWKAPGDSNLRWTRDLGNGWDQSVDPVPDAGSSAGPSLAAYNGTVYMAWKGVGGDPGLWWAKFDPYAAHWGSQIAVSTIPGGGPVATVDSPALVATAGILLMFWKGDAGDDTIWVSGRGPDDAAEWGPARQVMSTAYDGSSIAVGTTTGPSATLRVDPVISDLTGAPTDAVLLAWKGGKGDAQIWMNESTNEGDSGQLSLPDRGTSTGPAVVQALGSTFMAWKGVDSDDTIWWSKL